MLDKSSARTAMLKKLADSALNGKDAEQLGFIAYTGAELSAKPKLAALTKQPAAGFVIPYYSLDKEFTGFYRYRYLEQPPKNGFAALTASKPVRYVQPAGAAPRVYFSPLYDWASLFARRPEERALLITEGELKANCACKMGFPTLALGGVWNFKSSSEGVALIGDLKDLPLKDCIVYIVYDSDALSNPNVLMAENALARALLEEGARPYVTRLPALPKVEKTGLDDFLVKRGEKALTKLIKEAEEWRASAALHELNERVIFLRDSACVLELTSRHRWRASEFSNAVYATKKFLSVKYVKGTAVAEEKKTARAWIEWDGRAEVERVTYAPGGPPVVNGEYNAWRGWGIPLELIKRGSVEPWRKLIEFLFRGPDAAFTKWFEQWVAYPLQHPGVKLYQSVMMWGSSQGTGKSLVGYTIGRIYGANFAEINDRELSSSFNEWAEYKQFIMGDEITGGDKRASAEHLKGIVTQKELRVNPKYIKPYTVPDCINYYFTSNHSDVFFLEDHDRRFAVFEVLGSPMEVQVYRDYDVWYKNDENMGALFHHLLQVDTSDFNPHGHAPRTNARREMISDSRSDISAWCTLLREDPDSVLKPSGNTEPLKRRLFTASELHALYDPLNARRVTVNGLSRELKRAGFRKVLNGAPVRTSRGLVKLWAVRERESVEKLQAPGAIVKAYEDDIGWKAEKGKA